MVNTNVVFESVTYTCTCNFKDMLNRYIWNVAPIALAQSLECNGGQYVLQLHRKYEDNNDSVQKIK